MSLRAAASAALVAVALVCAYVVNTHQHHDRRLAAQCPTVAAIVLDPNSAGHVGAAWQLARPICNAGAEVRRALHNASRTLARSARTDTHPAFVAHLLLSLARILDPSP